MPEMFQYIHRGLTQSAIDEKVIVSGFWVEDEYVVVAQSSVGDIIDVEVVNADEIL
tara:strand:- start:1220 stop:1387 length:168 start_codon:yes stop_codon:yes gene_type:complete